MKLSLGPLLYTWDRDTVFEFYRGIRESPLDMVYLGEVVCPKRRRMRVSDWLTIADSLAASGKTVVLSTIARLETEHVPASQRRICRNKRFLVEANSIAAIQQLIRGKKAFVAGPYLNLHDSETLQTLARAGGRRWVLPGNLRPDDIATLNLPASMEIEVFAYGRMPLALSHRCLTAWANHRTRNNCGFICESYREGVQIALGDGACLVALNGIQAQSGSMYSLVTRIGEMQANGVDILRLSPQHHDMTHVIEAFHDVIVKINDTQDTATRTAQDQQAGGGVVT